MPALSPTMSHGNLASWTVKEGDEVSAGDALAEIETDKATLTWETQDDGIVGKILVPAGSKDVEVGTIVALLVDDAADVPKLASYAPPPTGVPTALSASMGNAMEVAAAAPTASAAPTDGDDTWHDRLGPAVRVLLETFHLDAEQLHHTGPHGILTKGDVLAAAQDGTTHAAPPRKASPPPAPPAPKAAPVAAAATPASANAPYVDIPVSQIRRIIASRLCESKQTIPHLYLTADVQLNEVAALRAALKKMGLKVCLCIGCIWCCVMSATALMLSLHPTHCNRSMQTTGVGERLCCACSRTGAAGRASSQRLLGRSCAGDSCICRR